MKGLIIIQNENNKCFRSCLVIYSNEATKNPEVIRKVDREFAKQLNFKAIKFLAQKKDYAKINENQHYSISFLKIKIHILKNKLLKNVDLLLTPNIKNSHFVLVKDFNRFMSNKIKHHDKKYFCQAI